MNLQTKELAEQANKLDYETWDSYNQKVVQLFKFDIEAFAELIRADQKEVDAKICESVNNKYSEHPEMAITCAETIRNQK